MLWEELLVLSRFHSQLQAGEWNFCPLGFSKLPKFFDLILKTIQGQYNYTVNSHIHVCSVSNSHIVFVVVSEEITAAFRRFGPLVVDWPHKAESKSYFPPKGSIQYIFNTLVKVPVCFLK